LLRGPHLAIPVVMRRLLSLVLVTACGASSGGGPAGADPDARPGDAASPDAAAVVVAPADPCPAVAPACPTAPSGFSAGDGLRAIDRCAFPLHDSARWDELSATIDAFPSTLPRVGLAEVLGDVNRAAVRVTSVPGSPPGLTTAFTWQSGDTAVAYWIPQGLTGSFDAGATGKRVLLVSWYYDQASDPGSAVDKGVRIAVIDASDPDSVRYRFALLVEPVMVDGRPDFAPVAVHAGGIAWLGDYLYVPVTGSGFRVFDLSRIFVLPSVDDRLGYDASAGYAAYSYRYAIPQVGAYGDAGACAPVFSFVAVDRSTATPTLVSGEYDAASVTGRLYRWPVDPASHRLVVTDAGRVVPDAAWLEGESHIQGGVSRGGTFWLSSSAPAGSGGALVRTAVDQPSATLPWIDAPEDLAFDPQGDQLWSLSERAGARYVFAAAAAALSSR
jgi:hypothetical protein